MGSLVLVLELGFLFCRMGTETLRLPQKVVRVKQEHVCEYVSPEPGTLHRLATGHRCYSQVTGQLYWGRPVNDMQCLRAVCLR